MSVSKRTGPARVRAVEESRARPAPAVVIADGPEPLPQAAIDLLLEMLARGRAKRGA